MQDFVNNFFEKIFQKIVAGCFYSNSSYLRHFVCANHPYPLLNCKILIASSFSYKEEFHITQCWSSSWYSKQLSYQAKSFAYNQRIRLYTWTSSGYNKPLRTVYWKMVIFQSKQPMTKQHHISLSSQFTALLNSMICFSVQFCDYSLLVLKMRIQVFSFATKKVQGFSSDWKILMLLLSVLLHLQNCISLFWNFNF